jgi:hypothetical protein
LFSIKQEWFGDEFANKISIIWVSSGPEPFVKTLAVDEQNASKPLSNSTVGGLDSGELKSFTLGSSIILLPEVNNPVLDTLSVMARTWGALCV